MSNGLSLAQIERQMRSGIAKELDEVIRNRARLVCETQSCIRRDAGWRSFSTLDVTHRGRTWLHVHERRAGAMRVFADVCGASASVLVAQRSPGADRLEIVGDDTYVVAVMKVLAKAPSGWRAFIKRAMF